jgi:hypothetical protein
MIIIEVNNIQLETTISPNNVHINDSYLVTDHSSMERVCEQIRKLIATLCYDFSRSNASWICEWKAHNFLFFIGIEKQRTGSVDLNEDEGMLKRIGYKLLSMCYDILFKFKENKK